MTTGRNFFSDSRVSVPAEFAGKAMLRYLPGYKVERLQYAAQALLDSMGLHIPLELVKAADDRSVLYLPGDVTVSAAELYEVFDCLSLDRERATGKHDRLSRFDETAVTWDVSKPFVDILALKLSERMTGHIGGAGSREHSFSVLITHDVDRTTFMEPWSVLSSLLGSFGFRRSQGVPIKLALTPGALLKCLESLLEYERSQGISARFFLMSGPYGLGRHSTRTDVRWASWRATAKLIQNAGMEIGLHGSFAARDRNSYGAEKKILEQVLGCAVTTHRNHYLRFDPERLCSQLEAAGIEYDFSVGYVSRVGFRSGSARMHRAFDPLHQRQSRLFSVPLIFMDTVLNRLGPREILIELRAALMQVRAACGCVCLVFHPETFLIDPRSWPLFQSIVQLCRELGADLSGKLP